ncbi:hypothetical protein, partial [Dickeya chrysanthemi]|uniref:hypothetical protein n=1 Tax=Dickeya chrysanthemi TaxID=556 RepID=UPI001EE6727E
LKGRSKLRSNPLPADLSFTRITYLSKLIGIHSLTALQGSNEPCPKGLTCCVVQNAARFVLQLELFWI